MPNQLHNEFIEYWQNYAVIANGRPVTPRRAATRVNRYVSAEVELLAGPAGVDWWKTISEQTQKLSADAGAKYTVVLNLLGPTARTADFVRGLAESIRLAWDGANRSSDREAIGEYLESDRVTWRRVYARVLDGADSNVLNDWVMSGMEAQNAVRFDVTSAPKVSPVEWATLTPDQLLQVAASIDAAAHRRARTDLLNLPPDAEVSVDQVNALLSELAEQPLSNTSKDQLVSLVHEQQSLGASLEFNGVACGISTAKRSDATTKRFKVQLTSGANRSLSTRSSLPRGLHLS